ncbi:MAG: histone deacetylase [Deltaproteobacteria bacterium]|nr:MAG: histone deacetylase [Deltaproteobacteria bacterium]
MIRAKRNMGLVFFPAFDWAIDPTHPEREERLLYTRDQVFEEGILDIPGITEFKPDLVTEADVRRIHFCVPDVRAVTTESHFISAGGAKTIGKAVMDKTIDCGFALVRPPGHHAMRVVHGGRGFCNINIEAIMIEYLRAQYGIRRVAIVDTDCHHGDGTQDIYWHDPDTLFISLHQDGRTLYPGSGFPNELGGPNAAGTTLNIPLPPQTGTEGYLDVIDGLVLPILDEFQPDLIINSAGQDNHYTDPLTNMHFSAQGYARLNALLKPDIAVLEGGYSIEGALPYVNAGIILAMAGLDFSHVKEPDYRPEKLKQSASVTRHIAEVMATVQGIWDRRDEYREKLQGHQTLAERRRQIYYDTDGISETQQERLTICNDCAGALRIDSSSSWGGHVVGTHIPRFACDRCRQQGLDWYAADVKQHGREAQLQDRSAETR